MRLLFILLSSLFTLPSFAQEPPIGSQAKADSIEIRDQRATKKFQQAMDKWLITDFARVGLIANTLVKTSPFLQYPAMNPELGAYLSTFEQETGTTIILRAYIDIPYFNPWVTAYKSSQKTRKAFEISKAKPAHAVIDIVYSPSGMKSKYEVAGYNITVRDSLRTPAFKEIFSEADFLRMRDTLQAAMGQGQVQTIDSTKFNAAVIRALEALKGDTKTKPDPGYKVTFRKGNAEGYDAYKYPALNSHYQRDAAGSPIPWLALDTKKSYTLKGRYQVTDPAAAKETPLKIVAEELVAGEPSIQDTLMTQSLSPAGKPRELTAEANYTRYNRFNKGVTTVAGQIALAAYEKLDMKLVVVYEQGNPLSFSLTDLKKYLDDVYGQAVVSWDVQSEAFDYSFPGEVAIGNSALSSYSSQMNTIIRAFKKSSQKIDGKTYYVFMVPSLSGGINGYMPMKGQFGFVKNSGDPAHTIAHELGHGAFRLWHTFREKDMIAAQGMTDNLMDYTDGKTRLYKHQWDLVHDPETMLMPFLVDEEEEMMIVGENHAKSIIRALKSINCATNRKLSQTKLYFPTSSLECKTKDLVSLLNLAGTDCSSSSTIQFQLIDRFGVVNDLHNDYVEDDFEISKISYEENKSITIPGRKLRLVINAFNIADNACVYKLIKSIIESSNLYYEQGLFSSNELDFDYLQYLSPCEFLTIKIEERKRLLTRVLNETNWYNKSIKDSRQKIAIQLINSTPDFQKNDLYTFLNENPLMINNFYDKIDDYREELIKGLIDLWKYNNKNVAANRNLTIAQHSLIQINTFWKTYPDGENEIIITYNSGGNNYTGFKQGSVSSDKFHPFNPVNIYVSSSLWNAFVGQHDLMVLDCPALLAHMLLDDAYTQDFYGYVKLAFLFTGISQTATAAKLLSEGVTNVGTWIKLGIGVSDVSTTVIEEYVNHNPNTDFSKAWIENREYIYGTLLFANITDITISRYAQKAKNLESLYHSETGNAFSNIGKTADIPIMIEDFIKKYNLKGTSIETLLGKAINNKADLLKKLQSWEKRIDLYTKLNSNLAKYTKLADNIVEYPNLLDEFVKIESTKWYRWRYKYKVLRGEEKSFEGFNKYVDELETGFLNKKLGDFNTTTTLGTHFDQYFSNLLLNGQFKELSTLNEKLILLSKSDDFVFESQLRVKMSPAYDNEIAILDNIAFPKNQIIGDQIKGKGYWVECKINPESSFEAGSSYSKGQKRLIEEIIGTNNTVEVRSTGRINVKVGENIEISNIIQISINDDGILAIIVK